MELAFRCGTKKAIDELVEELNLPNEKWMQDWPIEVVKPADIERYLNHYEKLTDEDKKFVLMEGILDATEYQPTEELFINYCNKVRPLLVNDFSIHEYTIHCYACFDTQIIQDCWKITPLMRQIWAEKTTNR